MGAIAAMVNASFRDPNLASNAIFRVGGNDLVAEVKVILNATDRMASFGEGRFVTASHTIEVRVSEVADLTVGDTFQIGDEVYAIQSDPTRGCDRLIWTAEVRKL